MKSSFKLADTARSNDGCSRGPFFFIRRQCSTLKALKNGSQFYLQITPYLRPPLPRKRSPDGATTNCGGRHLIPAYYDYGESLEDICRGVGLYIRAIGSYTSLITAAVAATSIMNIIVRVTASCIIDTCIFIAQHLAKSCLRTVS